MLSSLQMANQLRFFLSTWYISLIRNAATSFMGNCIFFCFFFSKEYFASNESRIWIGQFLLKIKPRSEYVNRGEDPKGLSTDEPSKDCQDSKKLIGEVTDDVQVITFINSLLIYGVSEKWCPFYVAVEELYVILPCF